MLEEIEAAGTDRAMLMLRMFWTKSNFLGMHTCGSQKSKLRRFAGAMLVHALQLECLAHRAAISAGTCLLSKWSLTNCSTYLVSRAPLHSKRRRSATHSQCASIKIQGCRARGFGRTWTRRRSGCLVAAMGPLTQKKNACPKRRPHKLHHLLQNPYLLPEDARVPKHTDLMKS